MCMRVCDIQEMKAHYNDIIYGVSSYRILISYRLDEQGVCLHNAVRDLKKWS